MYFKNFYDTILPVKSCLSLGATKITYSLIQLSGWGRGHEKTLRNQGLITAHPAGTPKAAPNEWGFSNKMLDLVRHMDKVRKA